MERRLLLLGFISAFSLLAQGPAPSFEDISGRASAARLANDVPGAIGLYRQGLQMNPKWSEGWLFLGTLLYDTDQYADSRDALVRFVALQPDVAPAWGLLGLCEYETAAYARALIHIQKSLAAGPAENPQLGAVLRFHEALLLARTGEFDRAIQKYAALVPNAAANPSLLTAIGIAALREPILPNDVSPGRQELFQAAGKAASLTMTGDYTGGERALQELIRRFPAERGVHYLYGFFLLARSPALSMAEFRRELEVNPNNFAAQAMLAWELLTGGDSAAALPYASSAAKGNPLLPTAQYAFGRSLVETGDLANGIRHLETAVQLDPENLEIHMALVTAYSKAGRTRDARSERERSVKLAQEVAPVLQN